LTRVAANIAGAVDAGRGLLGYRLAARYRRGGHRLAAAVRRRGRWRAPRRSGPISPRSPSPSGLIPPGGSRSPADRFRTRCRRHARAGAANRVEPRAFSLRRTRRHRSRRATMADRRGRRLRRPATHTAARGNATPRPRLPSDADLAAPGPQRSQAYDRAWWFARFIADTHGTATLRALYRAACGVGIPICPPLCMMCSAPTWRVRSPTGSSGGFASPRTEKIIGVSKRLISNEIHVLPKVDFDAGRPQASLRRCPGSCW